MNRPGYWVVAMCMAACSSGDRRRTQDEPAAPPPATSAAAANTRDAASAPVQGHDRAGSSPLAPVPDWSRLDPWQETMTRAEFERLLTEVYLLPDGPEGGGAASFIAIEPDRAVIRMSPADPTAAYELRFATDGSAAGPPTRERNAPERPAARTRPGDRAPAQPARPARPLAGLVIALDPGHIGGVWARTEWRWFQIGDDEPIAEGDLTLVVAQHLAAALRALGAEVMLVRTRASPVADVDPAVLAPVARKRLQQRGELHGGLPPARKRALIREESTRLAFRTGEIRARAHRINHDIEPDLTICIHFNAEKWTRPDRATLTDKNHMHLIVNGAYTPEELAYEDVRLDMLHKLITRTHDAEMAIARQVADSLASATGLAPESYPDTMPARRMTADGYIWARNLLANRIYRGPVLYLEPYVMNSREVYARLQAGDYEGTRHVAGARRPSIYREYAGAVAEGLAAHYGATHR